MARALIGKEEGDEVALQLTGDKKMFDIEEIKFVKIEIR
jgi:transcription elongation GreA/GreB family factor